MESLLRFDVEMGKRAERALKEFIEEQMPVEDK